MPKRLTEKLYELYGEGDPPYQEDDGGAGASASPIYHTFVEEAIKIEPSYISFITPSRWFSGGKGLDTFRKNMLNDKRIKAIHDYHNASELFPGVKKKGGVNYFLWDKIYNGNCSVTSVKNGKLSTLKRPLLEKGVETFIRYNEAISIFRKIKNSNIANFSDLVSTRKPFGLTRSAKKHTECYKKSI